jgi:hypothetical protein
MRSRKLGIAVAIFFLICLGLAARSEAIYIDDAKTLQFTAKAQAKVSFRMNNAEGYTYPNVRVGDLVQQRNLIVLQVDHDLSELKHRVGLLYPLKALKIEAKYRLVGRFMYEGIYDYGPQIFQDTKDRDKENITSFSQQYELWEFYVDLSRGPWFLRIGKQNLAWGEADTFRLLDGINPLDNTFGGPFEDLDDRRIPLWMIRGNYDLGGVGPISSLMVEGFWVPGNWDTRVSPISPAGTPFAAPVPIETLAFSRYFYPEKKMSNSRWGVRLQGLVGTSLNLTLAHYKSFPDVPATRTVVLEEVPILLDPSLVMGETTFPSIQITGGSLSYWEPHIDAIIRAEVAYVWDEPVFIPEENLAPLYGPGIPLPPPLQDLIGLSQIPINPQSGTIPKKDFFRYMIGIDKTVWIRPLNPKSTFFVSMQYFGSWVQDYDDRLVLGLPIYPSTTEYPKLYELEQIITLLVGTTYLSGSLTPQLVLSYDVRGAWLFATALNYVWEPFRFGISYAAIEGNFTGLGVMRDRDQLSFLVTYLLN